MKLRIKNYLIVKYLDRIIIIKIIFKRLKIINKIKVRKKENTYNINN